jgi:hypothetical protein
LNLTKQDFTLQVNVACNPSVTVHECGRRQNNLKGTDRIFSERFTRGSALSESKKLLLMKITVDCIQQIKTTSLGLVSADNRHMLINTRRE